MKLNLILTAALFATFACAIPSTVLGSDTTLSLIARARGQPVKPGDVENQPQEQAPRPIPDPPMHKGLSLSDIYKLFDTDPKWKFPKFDEPPDISEPVSEEDSEIRVDLDVGEYVLFWGLDLEPAAESRYPVLDLGQKYHPDNDKFAFPKPPLSNQERLVAEFKAKWSKWNQRLGEVLAGREAAPLRPTPATMTAWQAATKKRLEYKIYHLSLRKNFLVRYVDNTGKKTASSDKRDVYSRDVGAQMRERSVVSAVSVAEQNSTADGQSSHSDAVAQFQRYIDAFDTVQSNISDLLWPVFDTVLNGTTESIFVDIAWSIYSDLTGSTTHISGPFANGMNSIEAIESQLFNGTNNATTNHDDYLATAEILLEFYNDAWAKAVTAANQTGLLDYLAGIASYLATNDTSIVPAGFMTQPVPCTDDSYFTDYNKTLQSRRQS